LADEIQPSLLSVLGSWPILAPAWNVCPTLSHLDLPEIMSLLKIPFSASIIWAVNTTLTPPQSPPDKQERVGSIGFEVWLMPIVLKVRRGSIREFLAFSN